MFNFVCKTLLLHYGRKCCTITTTSNCNKDFAFPILIKCLCVSTATSSNQHSFTVSYLINSCGFSQKTALTTYKRVQINSPENADSVIALLKSHGFSETQISKVIRCFPRVLLASPDRTLLPKLEFFYSKGLSSPELARISSAWPQILERSLENYLIPTFNHLSDYFKSSETAIAAVKCNPFLFRPGVVTHIEPSINVLRDNSVPERNIFLFLRLWRWHRLAKTSLTSFKNTVEEIKEMGINPLNSQFILAVTAKSCSRNIWESKVEIYRRWGWSEEEFLAAFRKNALFMLASEDNIMRSMDFLVNKMKLEARAIAKRPDVILLSMEKRLIPRAAVFECLLSKGLVERENSSILALLTTPEKAFLRRFVNSFDGEAPDLLNIYQDKLGISKVTKTSAVSREGEGCSVIVI